MDLRNAVKIFAVGWAFVGLIPFIAGFWLFNLAFLTVQPLFVLPLLLCIVNAWNWLAFYRKEKPFHMRAIANSLLLLDLLFILLFLDITQGIRRANPLYDLLYDLPLFLFLFSIPNFYFTVMATSGMLDDK